MKATGSRRRSFLLNSGTGPHRRTRTERSTPGTNPGPKGPRKTSVLVSPDGRGVGPRGTCQPGVTTGGPVGRDTESGLRNPGGTARRTGDPFDDTDLRLPPVTTAPLGRVGVLILGTGVRDAGRHSEVGAEVHARPGRPGPPLDGPDPRPLPSPTTYLTDDDLCGVRVGDPRSGGRAD